MNGSVKCLVYVENMKSVSESTPTRIPTHCNSAESDFYEIRVANQLDLQGAVWFDGMSVTVDDKITPPQTIIRGFVEDQAALYGLISRALEVVTFGMSGEKDRQE